MKDGFSNAIYGIFGYNDDHHSKIRKKMGTEDYKYFREQMLSSETLVNLSDILIQLMRRSFICLTCLRA
jgi:hypothetical protein